MCAAFVELTTVVVQTEVMSSAAEPTANPESTTQLVLGMVDAALPVLVAASSGDALPESVMQYTQLMLSLIEGLTSAVDSSEIRAALFQILTTALAGATPCVAILPCLVKIALVDGEERQREVNQLLTGLLMNFKLERVGVRVQAER